MHLKPLLKQHHLDGLFVTSKPNINHLTGFTGTHAKVLLTKSKNYLLTDFRYLTEARKLKKKKISFAVANITKDEDQIIPKLLKQNKVKTLGFEANNLTVAGLKKLRKIVRKTAKLKPTSKIIAQLRALKTKEEIALIEKAQNINEKIFQKIKTHLKPGLSEKEIAWQIAIMAHELGVTKAFEPVVAFGENSACPHHQNTNKKLKKGDLILLDMGIVHQGYHSDMTRILFTQKPTPLQEKIYNLVLQAQENALTKIKPDFTCNKADSFARKIIEKEGYAPNFDHALGHGVGLEIHEKPNLCTDNREKLQPNMVFTIEPGIYLENKFGIRIEDLVVLEKTQVRNLTKTSKKIEIIEL